MSRVTVGESIKVTIPRFNPAADREARLETYEVPVPAKGVLTVMDAIEYIYYNLDPSLAFYRSCRRGTCSGCLLTINGKTGYACVKLAEGDLVLSPLKNRRVIRDLVVDMGDVTKGSGHGEGALHGLD